jgi:hypothetical protein
MITIMMNIKNTKAASTIAATLKPAFFRFPDVDCGRFCTFAPQELQKRELSGICDLHNVQNIVALSARGPYASLCQDQQGPH